jgi:hypothetical protein
MKAVESRNSGRMQQPDVAEVSAVQGAAKCDISRRSWRPNFHSTQVLILEGVRQSGGQSLENPAQSAWRVRQGNGTGER